MIINTYRSGSNTILDKHANDQKYPKNFNLLSKITVKNNNSSYHHYKR